MRIFEKNICKDGDFSNFEKDMKDQDIDVNRKQDNFFDVWLSDQPQFKNMLNSDLACLKFVKKLVDDIDYDSDIISKSKIATQKYLDDFCKKFNVKKTLDNATYEGLFEFDYWLRRNESFKNFLNNDVLDPYRLYDRITKDEYKGIIIQHSKFLLNKTTHDIPKKNVVKCLEKICQCFCTFYSLSRVFRTRDKHRTYVTKVLMNSRLFKEIFQTFASNSGFKRFLKKLEERGYHLSKDENLDKLDDLNFCAFEIAYAILQKYVSVTDKLGTTDIAYLSFMCKDLFESENTFALVLKLLYELHYDADVDQMVPILSRIIDVFHLSGSLADVFVEGGEQTCREVSSMSLEESYADFIVRSMRYLFE